MLFTCLWACLLGRMMYKNSNRLLNTFVKYSTGYFYKCTYKKTILCNLCKKCWPWHWFVLYNLYLKELVCNVQVLSGIFNIAKNKEEKHEKNCKKTSQLSFECHTAACYEPWYECFCRGFWKDSKKNWCLGFRWCCWE